MKQHDTQQLSWNDLVPYLLKGGPNTLNLSSGNPIIQNEVVRVLRVHYEKVIESKDFAGIVCQYNDPQGDISLRRTIASMYADQYQFPISADNIILTPGSQTAFFYISELARINEKRVYFPCGPEYPGYCTHRESIYRMEKPHIQKLDGHYFRYELSMGAYKIPEDTLFIMLSSPGNPTGKVLSAGEIEKLQEASAAQTAYLVIDGAYAPPVPDITFHDTHIQIPWTSWTIFTSSLSKAGLAGERLGVVVAPVSIVKQFLAIQSKITILASRLVQFVVNEMLVSGVYQRLSQEVIRPTYIERHRIARQALETSFPDGLSYYIFQSEGGPFLWVWFDELPISTNTLFFELLKRNLIVTPSSVFYLPSLRNWSHAHQCIRIGLVEAPEVIRKAVHILASTVCTIYGYGKGGSS